MDIRQRFARAKAPSPLRSAGAVHDTSDGCRARRYAG